jgi:hypothetical protein
VTRFRIETEAGRVPAARANGAMKGLARILVPLNFTAGPRFTHDPAYTTPPLPCLAVAAALSKYDGLMLGFAKTQMMRGQNRYVAAMRAATRLLT